MPALVEMRTMAERGQAAGGGVDGASAPTPLALQLVAQARSVGRLELQRFVMQDGGKGQLAHLGERIHHLQQRLEHWPPWLRVVLGLLLIGGGMLGILPILGFWMVPLGLAVLSMDVPPLQRAWERLRAWWHARQEAAQASPGRR